MKTVSYIGILLIFLCNTSCQKVIDINLNDVAPQIVIEGNVNDQSVPYSVRLSQTINFSESNTFPAISGALVKITDNSGTLEVLSEISPGNYTNSFLHGSIGSSYSLVVTVNGKDYEASSTMPPPVTIDSLDVITNSGGFGGTNRPNKRIEVRFQDPFGTNNYYRFGLIHYLLSNHVIQGIIQQKTISITSDRFRDGTGIIYNLSNGDDKFNSGDSIVVSLQSIDENVYTYFRTLNQSANNGQSATPVNPITNLSNGALGYFSAYSVRLKSIVIP